jgi:hypothetical protein
MRSQRPLLSDTKTRTFAIGETYNYHLAEKKMCFEFHEEFCFIQGTKFKMIYHWPPTEAELIQHSTECTVGLYLGLPISNRKNDWQIIILTMRYKRQMLSDAKIQSYAIR